MLQVFDCGLYIVLLELFPDARPAVAFNYTQVVDQEEKISFIRITQRWATSNRSLPVVFLNDTLYRE